MAAWLGIIALLITGHFWMALFVAIVALSE